jgi:hypothetical protein
MALLFVASIGRAGGTATLCMVSLGAAVSGGHAALIASLAAGWIALWVITRRQDRH